MLTVCRQMQPCVACCGGGHCGRRTTTESCGLTLTLKCWIRLRPKFHRRSGGSFSANGRFSTNGIPFLILQEANRESAARSRDKRLKLIADLELEVEELKRKHEAFKVRDMTAPLMPLNSTVSFLRCSTPCD